MCDANTLGIFKDQLKMLIPPNKDYKEACFEYFSDSPMSKKERYLK